MSKLETLPLALGALIILISMNASTGSYFNSIHAPCRYIDTVDLTGYHKFSNGSYLYEGIIIPPNLLGIFDYKDNELSERVPAEPHVRGCVCMLKPCVKLCCPLTKRFNGINCESYDVNSTSEFGYVMNITLRNGNLRQENLFNKFSVQFGRPCAEMYLLTPHLYETDNFSLFENGTLFRSHDRKYLSKDEFCLSLHPDNMTDIMFPANCYQPVLSNTRSKALVYACMMMFSVPFMILTIIVYLVIPELRTLHGKSLCCYLLGLCFGNSILSAFVFIPMDTFSIFQCNLFGFIAYFSFMASFFWVSVISFDIFHNIRAPRRSYNENKRFILYSVYAWGLALMFLGMTYFAQQSSLVPDFLKPAIGSDEYCWLDVKRGWSAMIYLYGPIIIIICFNSVMFILTSLQIHGVHREMSQMIESNDSQKSLRTEKDRFRIFLRLFIIMGVTWSTEIISYLIGRNSTWDKLFYVTDICNGIQGFLIFSLFVCKKKVKQYITKRYLPTSHLERQSQCSIKTKTSSINNHQKFGIGADKPLMVFNKN